MIADSASRHGLTTAEVARRLVQFGRNELQRDAGPPVWVHLARQFNSPLIWLLGAACTISFVLGEVADAIAIVTIVVLNGLIGFFQEYRA